MNKYDGGYDFDFDLSVFLLDVVGKCVFLNDFIFYNQFEGGNGLVVYLGDNLIGVGEGDDENVKVNFSVVFVNIDKILFVIIIYEVEVCS